MLDWCCTFLHYLSTYLLFYFLGFSFIINLIYVICNIDRHVQLRNARDLTTRGLRVLKGHKISDLEATGMKITVNDLIGCLGEWTLQNLRSLNVTGSTFMDDGSR